MSTAVVEAVNDLVPGDISFQKYYLGMTDGNRIQCFIVVERGEKKKERVFRTYVLINVREMRYYEIFPKTDDIWKLEKDA